MSVIRFKREWRRRMPGATDSEMTYGMHDTLVMRGIAEWVDKSPEHTSVISQPVLTDPEPEPEHRDRKSRRISSKESQ